MCEKQMSKLLNSTSCMLFCLMMRIINKGLGMRKLIAGSILLITSVGLAGCSDSPSIITDVKSELWMEFHNNVYTAKCNEEEIDKVWFITCAKDKDSPNKAVFSVDVLGDKEYQLYAVNGKAHQYSESFTKLHATKLFMDGKHPKTQSAWEVLRDRM